MTMRYLLISVVGIMALMGCSTDGPNQEYSEKSADMFVQNYVKVLNENSSEKFVDLMRGEDLEMSRDAREAAASSRLKEWGGRNCTVESSHGQQGEAYVLRNYRLELTCGSERKPHYLQIFFQGKNSNGDDSWVVTTVKEGDIKIAMGG